MTDNNTSKKFELLSPFSGKTIALSTLEDPVFSERLTGDGLAILCTGDTVLAPCDGTISLFFETKHAFAISTDEDIQILVHLGIDTVYMNGEGLTALKHPGDKVKAGEPVLKIDLEKLNQFNINLMSPFLIVNYDKIKSLSILPPNRTVEAGKDIVMSYEL